MFWGVQMCAIAREFILPQQNNQIINILASYIQMDDESSFVQKRPFTTSICITVANKIVETQTLYKLSI